MWRGGGRGASGIVVSLNRIKQQQDPVTRGWPLKVGHLAAAAPNRPGRDPGFGRGAWLWWRVGVEGGGGHTAVS